MLSFTWLDCDNDAALLSTGIIKMMFNRLPWTVLLVMSCSVTIADDKKPAFKPTKEEQEVLDLTNAERKKEQLPPLQFNAKLAEAARAHVMNMAKQEKLDHELDGKSMSDRLKDVSYHFGHAGENIAWKQPDAKKAIKSWMGSEGHRQNILSTDYTESGVGIAKSANGDRYWVQVFGTPLVK